MALFPRSALVIQFNRIVCNETNGAEKTNIANPVCVMTVWFGVRIGKHRNVGLNIQKRKPEKDSYHLVKTFLF